MTVQASFFSFDDIGHLGARRCGGSGMVFRRRPRFAWRRSPRPDGEHTIYNHAAERTAFVADWFSDQPGASDGPVLPDHDCQSGGAAGVGEKWCWRIRHRPPGAVGCTSRTSCDPASVQPLQAGCRGAARRRTHMFRTSALGLLRADRCDDHARSKVAVKTSVPSACSTNR
jgi:hypothetical protein